jgi:RNase P subunit RPR2
MSVPLRVSKLRLGDDTDTYCGRCKAERAHQVVALNADGVPASVICRTCGGRHRFREKKEVTAAPAAGAARRRRDPTRRERFTPKGSGWITRSSDRGRWHRPAPARSRCDSSPGAACSCTPGRPPPVGETLTASQPVPKLLRSGGTLYPSLLAVNLAPCAYDLLDRALINNSRSVGTSPAGSSTTPTKLSRGF